jgi:phage shock protein C
MYCTSCGTQIQNTANFCSECGRQTSRAGSAQYAPRRLYRLAYDKKWAGVCSGLARYLDVDVTLIRIAVVAVFFCSGGLAFLGYIAASIIMPVDYGPPLHVATEARATS